MGILPQLHSRRKIKYHKEYDRFTEIFKKIKWCIFFLPFMNSVL